MDTWPKDSVEFPENAVVWRPKSANTHGLARLQHSTSHAYHNPIQGERTHTNKTHTSQSRASVYLRPCPPPTEAASASGLLVGEISSCRMALKKNVWSGLVPLEANSLFSLQPVRERSKQLRPRDGVSNAQTHARAAPALGQGPYPEHNNNHKPIDRSSPSTPPTATTLSHHHHHQQPQQQHRKTNNS